MSQTPIIILGFPRSGTTLLRRMLDAHPVISCPGETFLLRSAARFLRGETLFDGLDYGVIGGVSSIGGEQEEILDKLRGLISFFHDRHMKSEGKTRWAEKTAVDAFYIDEIEALYGDRARFVCLVRHGLDVVASCRDLMNAAEVVLEEFFDYVRQTPSLDEAYATAWADSTRRLLKFADDHPDNACLMRYEDLMVDPEHVMKALMEFLEEEWNASIIDKGPSTIGNIGIGDWKTYGKNDIDNSSVDRWKNFSRSVIKRTAPIVNPILESCGYDPVESDKSAVDQSPEEALRRYEVLMRVRAVELKS